MLVQFEHQKKGYGDRTKHLHVKYLYVKHLVDTKQIEAVQQVDTRLNLADMFTKNVDKTVFKNSIARIYN